MDDTKLTELTATTTLASGDFIYVVASGNDRKVDWSDVITQIKQGGIEDDIETATLNAQTGTTYTLALTDRGQVVTMDNASANTITVPTNASADFDVGSVVTVIQKGAGATTITGDTGVTLNGTSAGSVEISAQYQGVSLLKVATDEWIASGAI